MMLLSAEVWGLERITLLSYIPWNFMEVQLSLELELSISALLVGTGPGTAAASLSEDRARHCSSLRILAEAEAH